MVSKTTNIVSIKITVVACLPYFCQLIFQTPLRQERCQSVKRPESLNKCLIEREKERFKRKD
jgi:hypothetical protein